MARMNVKDGILDFVENRRPEIIRNLRGDSKSQNGQFMTPASIARVMANFFHPIDQNEIRLLDPGAGSGALLSAFLDRVIHADKTPSSVCVVAYENDPYLIEELHRTRDKALAHFSSKVGLDIQFEIVEKDFISEVSSLLMPNLFTNNHLSRFTHAIINPPYRKIHSKSPQRHLLREIGIEAGNLYTAFVSLALKTLEIGGELVAITPRSFCNGPYFKRFRRLLLTDGSIPRIHVFHSRESAFHEDDVLQENIIFLFEKGGSISNVTISSSTGRDFSDQTIRTVDHSRVVNPKDKHLFIHIPTSELDDHVYERISVFNSHLSDFNFSVSTGPVVDFRLRRYIKDEWEEGFAPLIYPAHFESNIVSWPLSENRKPNAIQINTDTTKWLMPNEYYVLLRRFSSKEEERRIFPALFEPLAGNHDFIGFENHLNVIHSCNRGIRYELAKGLTAYYMSSIVDLYFRQFSGHTQVNATDLRMLPIPEKDILIELARFFRKGKVSRSALDNYLENLFESCFRIQSPNPIDSRN
jgi:adenine-specific DNA-methyltransferase